MKSQLQIKNISVSTNFTKLFKQNAFTRLKIECEISNAVLIEITAKCRQKYQKNTRSSDREGIQCRDHNHTTLKS